MRRETASASRLDPPRQEVDPLPVPRRGSRARCSRCGKGRSPNRSSGQTAVVLRPQRLAMGELGAEKKLLTELRKLDRHGLRRVLIFVRGLLMTMGDPASGEEAGDPEVTYRLESVRC